MILSLKDHVPEFLGKQRVETDLLGDYLPLGGASLISIGSRPGMGKTALALTLALDFARKTGKSVYIFSYDMTAEQVCTRMLSILSGVSASAIKEGNLSAEELNKLEASYETVRSLKVWVDDEMYVSRLEMEARLCEVEDLGMVIVDYLGMMVSPFSVSCEETDENSAIICMRSISRIFDVPVIFTHQLPRSVEGRKNKRPEIADLGRSIQVAADTALLLYRESYYRDTGDEGGRAEILIVKNRYGGVGTLYSDWHGETMSFERLGEAK